MLRPSPRPCPSSHQRTQPISLLTGQDLPTTSHEACGGGRTVQKELTLEEFHASDPQRAAAPEVPYGSLWREFAPVPTYRLAWVPTTGELYAMELSEPDEDKDPVEVLGVLWSRPPSGGLPCRLVRALWRPAVAAVGPRADSELASAG